jgi:MinD-like ATPase involved in chromosome partitioning or flagellar assembly
MEPTIALVFSPEIWVERLHRHLTDHGGARVRQIVLEPTLALEDEYDTLVVSHRWPGLTKPFIDAVQRRTRCVLGVFDPDEAAGREHLAALGVDATIASDAPVAEFIETITALMPTRLVESRARDTITRDTGRDGPTVVSGPSGAGASEIVLGLAAVIATRGERPVLVDADEIASSTATRLGLPIEPNLRTAIDAVEYGGGDLAATLVGIGRPGFDVLCGFPSAAAAAQVRPRDVLDVLAALAHLRSPVLVEVTGVPGAEIARAVAAEAGALVGVGAASPVGVTRLLAWIGTRPANGAPVHVVLNRAPNDRFQRAELTAEIYRTFTPVSLMFVPTDRRVDRAAWAGELVPRGPFTTCVAAVAQTAVPRAARPGRAVRRSRRTRRAA